MNDLPDDWDGDCTRCFVAVEWRDELPETAEDAICDACAAEELTSRRLENATLRAQLETLRKALASTLIVGAYRDYRAQGGFFVSEPSGFECKGCHIPGASTPAFATRAAVTHLPSCPLHGVPVGEEAT